MQPLIQSLLRPEAYPHPVQRLELLETHISWVILTGEYAYKLKKPVDFGFVNFTTLELRQHFCAEEVRLNQRLAADLYLGVVPIFGPLETQASLLGEGEPIEYAVQMRQFSQSSLLPQVLARHELTESHIDQFADDVARFHDQAAVATTAQPFGEFDAIRNPALANLDVLARLPEFAMSVSELRQWSESEFERLQEHFVQRKHGGRVRECHGDLHLGNLVLRQDRIEAFDCLEFNAELRWIDVISEIAFLVMDLAERGRPDLAFRVLNRWLEQTGDYAGVRAWRWYFVYRALVRAKVASLRLGQPDQAVAEVQAHEAELRQYLELAHAATRQRLSGIVLTHGVSGSGKSFVSQQVCQQLGAIRIRSDVERKRLFGDWGIPRTPTCDGDLYTPEITARLYREVLVQLATDIVESGFVVVVDATFLEHWQREVFRELADKLNVPLTILDLPVSVDTARERIRQRQRSGQDASDAGLDILERQLAQREPLSDDERLMTIPVAGLPETIRTLCTHLAINA